MRAQRQLSDKERRDWLRLICTENVGPATFKALIERYGEAARAIDALPDLSRRGGLKRSLRVCPTETAEAHLERADALGARFVAIGEPDYPALLAEIDDAPPLLCCIGSAALSSRPAVAIVGARNASALGRKFARGMAADLCAAGFCVVSGLARGIDTAAHEASVGEATVAVVAGGIDIVYPPENAALQERIAREGRLVTEMVPGTRPQAQHFPRRNRIISGMSLGVVVVEAARRSGSLITARLALEQNREVFAVPGNPLDPRAEGTNHLIREGALLTRSARDVVDALSPMLARPTSVPAQRFEEENEGHRDNARISDADLGAARTTLLELIGTAAVQIDDLIRESGLEARTVMPALLELEIAGLVERQSQQRVCATR